MQVRSTCKLLWWFGAASGNYAAVASIARGQSGGTWAVYLGLCRSQDEDDLRDVIERGAKLPEDVARAFARGATELADVPYRT